LNTPKLQLFRFELLYQVRAQVATSILGANNLLVLVYLADNILRSPPFKCRKTLAK
jgi:hypothetical protein